MRGIGIARAKYRYKTDPAFRERAKKRGREAYHSNPEMYRERAREYYRQHKEKCLALYARYRRKHPKETRQYMRAWRLSEKGRTYKAKLRTDAADCYIRVLLRRDKEMRGVAIPDELIKEFRKYLLLLREIKKAKEAINGTGN
jgi:Na+-translocating ferredoxin:NAD+ oxidoreductase RnfC subunit